MGDGVPLGGDPLELWFPAGWGAAGGPGGSTSHPGRLMLGSGKPALRTHPLASCGPVPEALLGEQIPGGCAPEPKRAAGEEGRAPGVDALQSRGADGGPRGERLNTASQVTASPASGAAASEREDEGQWGSGRQVRRGRPLGKSTQTSA